MQQPTRPKIRRLAVTLTTVLALSFAGTAHANLLTAIYELSGAVGRAIANWFAGGFTREVVVAAPPPGPAEAEQATLKLQQALREVAAQAHGNAPTDQRLLLSSRSTLRAGFHAEVLPSGRLKMLGTVSRLVNKLPRVVIASSSARDFGQEFVQGAGNGTFRLKQLQFKTPALLDAWLNAPRDKRVFVIGAAQDEPDVLRLRDALKQDGFETFFYKFCEPLQASLCTSSEVGAFFASAGHAVVVKSAAASASSYVPVELAAADRVAAGGLLIVFTPDDVAKLATTSTVALPAVVFHDGDPEPSRSRQSRR